MVTAAILLDALGTLVHFEPPVPRLIAALQRRGAEVAPADAGRAIRAEIAHYRANHHRAGDTAALQALRRECAAVLGAQLGAHGLADDELHDAMLESFEFTAYPEVPEVLEQLRADGRRLVVLSNWDISLHEVLALTGLQNMFDGVVISAEAGLAKPDPRIFELALAAAGVAAGCALHAGDSFDEDVAGAQAAGVRPVLVDREGEHTVPPAGVTVLSDLRALPAIARG